MDKLLTKAEVCEVLSVSPSTLDRLIGEKALPVYRVRGCVRFRRSDLEAYLARILEPARPAVTRIPAAAPTKTKTRGRSPVQTPGHYYPGMKVV